MSDFQDQKNIHYFPGHMKKALLSLKPFIKIADVIVEICDARIPISSRNPLLSKEVLSNKPRLLILSKTDRADKDVTCSWVSYFSNEGMLALSANLKGEKIISILSKALEPLVLNKREKEKRNGMKPQPIRLLVLGIPNVGKSTFINNVASRKVAIAANRPGVTRSEQWIRLGKDFALLDTPGILPMNYENLDVAMKLAMVGSIREEILPVSKIASELVEFLIKNYPNNLLSRYPFLDLKNTNIEEIFSKISTNRGYLLSKGKPDIDKAELLLLKDFQNGELGNTSLEKPTC